MYCFTLACHHGRIDLELRGHVAVITGGATGIGLACGRALTREGCRIALWDVTPSVAQTAAELSAECGEFGFPFTHLEPTDWAAVLEVNIMGMVHVAQALAGGRSARRGGTMVFTASVAGQIGSQTDPPSSAS